jgi:glyceraldehyde-3-phosphate dehydrogenase (NADP+)
MAGTFDTRNGRRIHRLFVNGEWVRGRKTLAVRDPSDGSAVASVYLADKALAAKAVDAAYAAKPLMARMTHHERSALLQRFADELQRGSGAIAKSIMREVGKPLKMAEEEIARTVDYLRFTAEEAHRLYGEAIPGDAFEGTRKLAFTVLQPVGVVLAISPFNYPVNLAVDKIAPALAAGNAVVLKAPSDAPISLLMLGSVAQKAGVPRGALNIIAGSSAEIGDFICSHEKIDMISFTGSSAVGQRIAKAAGMKKLHMELGGKSPALVLEDADLQLAARECVKGSFKFAGQRCDAVSRVLVVDSIASEFVQFVLSEAKKWRAGNPKEGDFDFGPLVNEQGAKKVEALVNDAVAKGARLLLGGRRKGLYFQPTVLDGVTSRMRIAWEETFGPVVTIMRVKDFDDAVRIANASEYGLHASVFTQDVDKALKAALLLEDGSVQVNGAPARGPDNFPFGGDKKSGLGREGAEYAIREMSRIHAIVLNPK